MMFFQLQIYSIETGPNLKQVLQPISLYFPISTYVFEVISLLQFCMIKQLDVYKKEWIWSVPI